MAHHEETEYGKLKIGRGVVESVCARIIEGFDGRVLTSNPKGRLRRGWAAGAAAKGQAPVAEEETGFARARWRGGRLDVKLYLIVQFGASLRDTAAALAGRLREEFPAQAGLEVGLVTLVFVGTVSEKLSRRLVVFEEDGAGLREVSQGDDDGDEGEGEDGDGI